MAERIAHLLTEFNIKNPRQFALSIGMDPSFFNKVINAEVAISEKYIDKICAEYNVDKEWLLHDIGKLKADNKVPSFKRKKEVKDNVTHENKINEPNAIYQRDTEIEFLRRRVQDLEKIILLQQKIIDGRQETVPPTGGVKNAG